MPTNSLLGSGHEVVTSTTRPSSPITGQIVYETDTQELSWYTGSGWSGLIPAGTISAHSAATAPAGWLLCYGQAVSRSVYPNLFAALGGLSFTSPGTRPLGSFSTLTGMTGMLPAYVGLSITGYAVAPNTVIASVIDSTSITLSQATASLPLPSTATYTIGGLLYGNGDGSTTFNVPDMRGVRPAGLDNMGGTTAGRLGSATSLGALQGGQYMQQHTHTYSGSGTSGNDSPDHGHQWPLSQTQGGRDGNDTPARSMYAWDPNFRTGWRAVGGYNAADRPHTHGMSWSGNTGTTFSGGSGNMPPSMVLTYVIRH